MRGWIVGLAACGLVAVGCSSSSGSSAAPAATSVTGSGTTPVGTTPVSGGGEGGVYLVQEGGAASLTPSGSSYQLVVQEARPRTVVFSGAPDPRAETASTAGVVEVLGSSKGTHEAALTWGSPQGAGTVVVTIDGGSYDEASGTLTYTVQPVEPAKVSSAAVATRAQRQGAPTGSSSELAASVPSGVTSSTLFIDPLGQDRAEADCTLTIANSSPFGGVIGSIDPTDRGGMADWDSPLQAQQPLAAGARVTASSGNSAWDCHANVTVVLTDSTGDQYDVYVALRDPVFDKSTWSCVGPPQLACDVTANASGQPLDMTVTISA